MRDSALESPDDLPAGESGGGRLPVVEAYRRLVLARGMVLDRAQETAVARLQRMYDEWVAYKARRRTRLQKMIVRPPLPRGVYFWGGVGRGKSLLMDLFYATVPVMRKTRIHFHAFMREVHRSLESRKGEEDPLVLVAKDIARRHRLICLDEFHVSDIADAMILGRLLQELFRNRVVLCTTSNYPPAGLYPNGLQRERFFPAIRLLESALDVVNVDGGTDYRLQALRRLDIYRWPQDPEGERVFDRAFREIAEGGELAPEIQVYGRPLRARRRGPGVIWFDFETLCAGARSQNDYLEVAREYHTLLLSGVPRMGLEAASAARRFTWLVDVMYDHRVKLLMLAEVAPEALYREGPGAAEFARTASRLHEMQSEAYLAQPHLN